VSSCAVWYDCRRRRQRALVWEGGGDGAYRRLLALRVLRDDIQAPVRLGDRDAAGGLGDDVPEHAVVREPAADGARRQRRVMLREQRAERAPQRAQAGRGRGGGRRPDDAVAVARGRRRRARRRPVVVRALEVVRARERGRARLCGGRGRNRGAGEHCVAATASTRRRRCRRRCPRRRRTRQRARAPRPRRPSGSGAGRSRGARSTCCVIRGWLREQRAGQGTSGVGRGGGRERCDRNADDNASSST
jgi:hypothetical protein